MRAIQQQAILLKIYLPCFVHINILFLYVNLLIDGLYMLYRYQNYLTEASSKRLLDALNPVSREDQVTYTLRCLTLKRQKSTNRALERRKNLRICC